MFSSSLFLLGPTSVSKDLLSETHGAASLVSRHESLGVNLLSQEGDSQTKKYWTMSLADTTFLTQSGTSGG
jgi:hypothetical protein